MVTEQLHTLLLAHSTFLIRTAMEAWGWGDSDHTVRGDCARGQPALILLPMGHLESEVGLLGVPGQPYWPHLSAGTETHQGLSPWPCLKISQNRLFPGIGEPEGGRKNSLCVRSPGPGSPPEMWALACASPVLAKAALGFQAESVGEPGALVTPQLHISQLGSLGKPPNLSESVFCLSNVGGELGRPQGVLLGHIC